MNYLELSPDEIRTRWGSFYSIAYDKKVLDENVKALNALVGDDHIWSLPFINRDLAGTFMSYYNKCSCVIREQVGDKDRLNHWDHQFETLEECIEVQRKKAFVYIDEIKEKLLVYKKLYYTLKVFAFFHLLPAKAIKRIEATTKLLQVVRDFNEGGLVFQVEPLTSRKMDSNTPSLEDDFYVAGTSYGNPYFGHFKVDEVSVYDFHQEGCEDVLQFNVNLKNVNPQDKQFQEIGIDSERLNKSDGKTFELSLYGYKAFRNEVDAKDFITNCVQDQIENLQKFSVN